LEKNFKLSSGESHGIEYVQAIIKNVLLLFLKQKVKHPTKQTVD